MKNKDLLKYIWEHYSNYIIENYKEICALRVTGSRGIELIDERSDWDIEVYLWDEEYREQPQYNLFYKDTRVHWYYHNPKNWLKPRMLDSALFYSGLADLYFINQDSWFSCTQEGDKLYSFLYNNKEFLSDIGCKAVLSHNTKYFSQIKQPEDMIKMSSKLFYHQIKAWLLLHKQNLPKDYLLQIKRIRWREIPQETLSWGFEILNQINLHPEEYYISNEEKEFFKELWRNYGFYICK